MKKKIIITISAVTIGLCATTFGVVYANKDKTKTETSALIATSTDVVIDQGATEEITTETATTEEITTEAIAETKSSTETLAGMDKSEPTTADMKETSEKEPTSSTGSVKPASTGAVKPATTEATKPASTSNTSTKPASTSNTNTKPASTTSTTEAAKPSNSGGSTTTQAKKWVVDKAAWTEKVWVVDKAAWTETVEHPAEYTIEQGYKANGDNTFFKTATEAANYCYALVESDDIELVTIGVQGYATENRKVLVKDAWTETVQHPEEGHYETIQHEEVGHWE